MTENPETQGLFWEQLEGESATAYSAFCCYRDMGITRSLRRAAAKFYAGDQAGTAGSPEVGTSGQVARFKEWSRRWMWVARVEAFDGEEARERSMRMRERRIKTAELHWKVGQLAMQRVAERLQNIAFDEYVPLKSLAQIMNAAGQLQRLALGEPTAIEDVRGTTRSPEEQDLVDISDLSQQDQEELARIAGLLDDSEYLPGPKG